MTSALLIINKPGSSDTMTVHDINIDNHSAQNVINYQTDEHRIRIEIYDEAFLGALMSQDSLMSMAAEMSRKVIDVCSDDAKNIIIDFSGRIIVTIEIS